MFRNKITTWYPGAVLLTVIVLVAMGGSVTLADFTFGAPTNLGPAMNSPGMESGPSLSADGKQLYFTRWTDTTGEIWACQRATVDSAWEPASRLGPPLATDADECPFLTSDGLSLYFDSWRDGGTGGCDLWMTTSAIPDGSWGAPVNLGPAVNSASDDWCPSISADGLELYFSSNRPGGSGTWDIWTASRATVNDTWGSPVNLGASINTEAEDCWPSLSPDGLVLFFTSNRSGGQGSWDLYMARRTTRKDPWGSPTNFGPLVNSPEGQGGPKVSFDGLTLCFYSLRSDGAGLGDIWQTPILPIVDFNADKKVDLVDLVMLIENWGSNKTLYDIGPYAWGDGKVDIEDLKVFMTYYEKEHPPAKP